MPISFEQALGIHEQALLMRSQRSAVIAQNIANADTPNYKAQDLDFAQALQQANEQQLSLSTTSGGHVAGLLEPAPSPEMLYRVPTQPSIDGNTVDLQGEMARFSDNAVRFNGSFTFLNSKFSGLSKAIKGE